MVSGVRSLPERGRRPVGPGRSGRRGAAPHSGRRPGGDGDRHRGHRCGLRNHPAGHRAASARSGALLFGLAIVLLRTVVHEMWHAIVCAVHGIAPRELGIAFWYGFNANRLRGPHRQLPIARQRRTNRDLPGRSRASAWRCVAVADPVDRRPGGACRVRAAGGIRRGAGHPGSPDLSGR